jgi:hypothetical protein
VRQRCRSQCGTEVPNFHTESRHALVPHPLAPLIQPLSNSEWIARLSELYQLSPGRSSQEPRPVATGGDPDLFAHGSLTWMWSPTGADLVTVRRSSLGKDPQTIRRSTLSAFDPVTGETTDLESIDGDVASADGWSPDGTRIAFGARGGAVYSADVRSGERSLLVRLPGEDLDSVRRDPVVA